jgi:hypothetical protein
MRKRGIIVLLYLAASFLLGTVAWGATLQNAAYRVELQPDGAVVLGAAGSRVERRFAPVFTILWAAEDPELAFQRSPAEAYVVPSWKSREGARTTDMYHAAARVETVKAVAGSLRDGVIRWEFPALSIGRLEAEMNLPADSDPRISFRFAPASPGWYSIGYTGSPEVPAADIEWVWQPLVWQERRFPSLSFLSIERMCSLPAAIVSSGGATVAVAADAGEIPFRIPTFRDSRFGVLVRSREGRAQPALFAPVLGGPGKNVTRMDLNDPWRYGAYPPPDSPDGPGSYRKAGEPLSFRLRVTVQQGDWYATFRHIAAQLYRFHDYRENVGGSLNDTLENMVAFAMDDVYGGWVEDLKGFDYTTDVRGTVKNVSALHPLSVALLTDNREIFRRRALPIVEYLMSREKYLFSVATGIEHQNPSHFMRGPAAEVSELAALYLMSGGRSTVLRHYAEALNGKPRALNLMMVSEGRSWQNELALYRMTGDRGHLDEARSGADRYLRERIDRVPTDFADVHVEQGGQFWTDFTPKWIDLFELYEETRDTRYLEAAAAGAREYATLSWFQPSIPDADIVVNRHGQVGVHTGMAGERETKPMQVAEQTVPAWQVSQIGLVPEASTTYGGNPAVFLAHHAAYMLRIGVAVHDPFLSAVARSAIVGRYTNFPGYDINGEYTNVYARPDYPLRPFSELTYNQIYYNHVWPQIALLFDYLISDVDVRSGGQIRFPSRYAQGYAYLQSKVYGDRPGSFYGNEGVRLWMPAKLLRIDDLQINYLSGYDGNALYIALSNQSKRPVTARIRVNPNLAPYTITRDYNVRTWSGVRAGAATKMHAGEIEVAVPPSGLSAIAIDGVRVAPLFQREVSQGTAPLSEQSYAESATPLGKVTGMLLAFGGSNNSAYVWLEATEQQIQSARLHYRLNETGWKVLEDSRYPYEFSLPAGAGARTFSYWLEATRTDGSAVKSDTVELKK